MYSFQRKRLLHLDLWTYFRPDTECRNIVWYALFNPLQATLFSSNAWFLIQHPIPNLFLFYGSQIRVQRWFEKKLSLHSKSQSMPKFPREKRYQRPDKFNSFSQKLESHIIGKSWVYGQAANLCHVVEQSVSPAAAATRSSKNNPQMLTSSKPRKSNSTTMVAHRKPLPRPGWTCMKHAHQPFKTGWIDLPKKKERMEIVISFFSCVLQWFGSSNQQPKAQQIGGLL